MNVFRKFAAFMDTQCVLHIFTILNLFENFRKNEFANCIQQPHTEMQTVTKKLYKQKKIVFLENLLEYIPYYLFK